MKYGNWTKALKSIHVEYNGEDTKPFPALKGNALGEIQSGKVVFHTVKTLKYIAGAKIEAGEILYQGNMGKVFPIPPTKKHNKLRLFFGRWFPIVVYVSCGVAQHAASDGQLVSVISSGWTEFKPNP